MRFSTLRLLKVNFDDNARNAILDKNTMLYYCEDLKRDIKLIGDMFDVSAYKQSIKDIESKIFDISECVKYADEKDYNAAVDRFCKFYDIPKSAININALEKTRKDANFSLTSEYVRDMYYINIFI